jgi:hypothetical protein
MVSDGLAHKGEFNDGGSNSDDAHISEVRHTNMAIATTMVINASGRP